MVGSAVTACVLARLEAKHGNPSALTPAQAAAQALAVLARRYGNV